MAQNRRAIEIHHVYDQFRSPGLSLRYQQAVSTQQKIKKKGKVATKMISIGFKYTWYRRNDHHTAHVLAPYIQFERKSRMNVIFQSEIGLGCFLRKQLNPTYTVIDNDLKSKNEVFHRFYPFLGIGIGYDFEKWTNVPIAFVFRPSIGYEVPNNTSGLIHLQSEVGIRYAFR